MSKTSQSASVHHEYIIIGAGPAGLQMGYFLGNRNRSYTILEAAEAPGAFFRTYPRHRTLLSINKRFNYYPEADYNLRHDWNSLLSDDESLLFRNYSEDLYPSADDLVRYLEDYASRHSLQIRLNTRVKSVWRENGRFLLRTASGQVYSCERLLNATGAVIPHIPQEIKGIEHACGYHDCSIDPSDYENQRVAVIGSGNSAFEVANHISGHAAIIHILVRRPVRHAWQTHFVGDLRAINNTVLDMYQLKSLHATVAFVVQEIIKNPDGTVDLVIQEDLPHWKTPGSTVTTITYDKVVYCTGWTYSDQAIYQADCLPALDEKNKYPALSSCWESSVPGLYYLGASMAARDRKSASGFIHGFRYNIQTLFHILEEQYHGQPLPHQSWKLEKEEDLDQLTNFLILRLSITSALYQLNEFMCDALVLSAKEARLYTELPVDYVRDRKDFMEQDELFLFTLEYGFHNYPSHVSPLDFIHPADQLHTSCSAFLHPVVRCYSQGRFVEELHLGESLLVRFDVYDYEENIGGVHQNMLRNLINRRIRLTDRVYAEQKYSGDVFTVWNEEQIRQREKLQQKLSSDSPCRFAV